MRTSFLRHDCPRRMVRREILLRCSRRYSHRLADREIHRCNHRRSERCVEEEESKSLRVESRQAAAY